MYTKGGGLLPLHDRGGSIPSAISARSVRVSLARPFGGLPGLAPPDVDQNDDEEDNASAAGNTGTEADAAAARVSDDDGRDGWS